MKQVQPLLCPRAMKKSLPLFAAAMLGIVATAPAAIIFNPDNPLNVVDQGGLTGTFTPPLANPFIEARISFNFSGLDPSPLPSSFQISGISLEGQGIDTSLSFSSINVSANGFIRTAWISLDSNVASLDLANNLVSFSLPGGVINDAASFEVTVSYRDATEGQVGTSSPLIYTASSVEPIPEPGTWAAAALLVGGAAYMRWRRRQTA